MNNQQLMDLVNQMTLEEKVAQLLQLTANFYEGTDTQGQITGPMEEMGITEQSVNASGSILGLSGAQAIMDVQQAYLKKSRLGIPLLFMADVVHGFKTIFPIPLAIGCSWDLELAEKSAEIAARESAVSGLHVTFAPMVDLVRDPRWGRVMETTGEDPYLNSLFAAAFVRGYQGDNLTEEVDRLAACVKHFAAYGAAEGGRDYNTVDMSERQLREYYLPAYKAALDAGVEMVMTSFNTVDGIPASGNEKLMRGILRDEWGFDGVLISDWASIREMIAHGAAEDDREAAYRAIRAGVDMEMMTPCYVNHLPELIQKGEVEERLVNEAVLRILQLKDKLGLFDNPFRAADPEREREIVFSKEHREVSRELAAKSAVLLKNEAQVLPLQPDANVALIGPFAQSEDILGWWACEGVKADAVKLGTALQERLPQGTVRTAQGSDVHTITEEQVAAALEAAQHSDVIVLALGEDSEMSGEAGSRTDIRLPAAQLQLVQALKATGKPIASVIFNGRPLDLHGVVHESHAVLEAWFPGSEGGAAIADVLTGAVNPSGRLTMSFPQSVGQVPVYYNHFNTGRPINPDNTENRYVSKYLDSVNEPLFPFGYGLSYTSFVYGEVEVSAEEMTASNPLTVQVSVTNTGDRHGVETVQLYVRDVSGDVVRPMRELKDYVKLSLAPGESGTATFTLSESQLRYHHADLGYHSDRGEFRIMVGPNSSDTQSRSFKLV
ncbi:glycoside hydrolase family 3 N-terminal domain-containing protein [Paenibacillus silvae]|uniref:glycoside hydrolase family 3 N-terminal domain-containing protein n=1 Tax=Paenibacillus silvae TaxID=1325358 RepID=UPI00119E10D3|nr:MULTISPECIES: glycoside hydrolase family 3 N-terminal domain-containing protein [Paenibacillus]MCK6074426.1 glycoside hydrolase family 3 C-terminal domain-containing protein [Paenibacillus silvae]MCK6148096.1 glycoside hydrolase family 3 C-terminal domain-containing protein [Paenibacillus silvae]MCK6266396.1 glycoside hydrolase family 3 C-terminal domain-containing protein [Paenibacillus silvae]